MDMGVLQFADHNVLNGRGSDNAGFKGKKLGGRGPIKKKVEGNVVENEAIMRGFAHKHGAGRTTVKNLAKAPDCLPLCFASLPAKGGLTSGIMSPSDGPRSKQRGRQKGTVKDGCSQKEQGNGGQGEQKDVVEVGASQSVGKKCNSKDGKEEDGAGTTGRRTTVACTEGNESGNDNQKKGEQKAGREFEWLGEKEAKGGIGECPIGGKDEKGNYNKLFPKVLERNDEGEGTVNEKGKNQRCEGKSQGSTPDRGAARGLHGRDAEKNGDGHRGKCGKVVPEKHGRAHRHSREDTWAKRMGIGWGGKDKADGEESKEEKWDER